jgi:hypothetical protein
MPRGDSDQPDYMPLYEEAGQKHHVDPDLLGAVGDVESHQDRYAESPAGAGGLMQLMPGTAEELNVTDRFDPRQSVFGGTRYLRRQLDSFNNVNDALSAYNAGPHGNWDNEETQNYVEAVNARWHARRMARLQRQQQPPAAPEAPPPSGGLFDDVLHKQSPAAQTGGLFDDVLPQTKPPPAQQSLPPAQRDEAAPPAPPPEPARDAGWLETVEEAAKAPFRGARQTFQTALTGRPGEEAPPPNIEAAQPITVEDFKHPLTLGKKALYGVVSSSPEMAAFFGTSWLGGGPETPPGIAVGSLGAALAHSMTTFGPAFGAELRQTPNDPDAAFHRAFVKTGIGAAATGVGFELFGAVNPFESALKNLAFQAFGVQPAVSAGEQVATNVNEGRPTLEGVAEGYVPSVIGAAVPIVGFEGAKLAGHGVQAVTDAMRPVPAPLQVGLDAQRQGAAGAQGQPGAPPPQQGPPPPPMGPPPPPQGPPEAPHGPPPPPQGPPPPPQGPPPPPAAPPPTDPQSVLVDIARGGDGTGKPPTNPPAANPPLTPPPSPAPETANPPISPLTRPPEGEPATRPIAPPEAPIAPTSGSYVMLRPDQLNVDPARFQYKEADESGVTGVLRGAKKWESDLADPILAWQDNDGKMWVVNGHQRMDLARRAEAAGQTDIQIPARIMREADGYTPDYMRALGAYVNIAQGSGTAIDAAKVLRTIGSLPPSLRDRLPQLSTTGAVMRDAKGLVALSDEAFSATVNGVVPYTHAAHVGALIPNDPAMQMAAIQVLAKAHPGNAEQARIIVEDVRNQAIERQHQGAQGTLTGFEPQAQSLVPQRAQVLDYVLRLLRQAKSRYSGAIKGEGTLTSVEGNKINVEGTQAARSQNEEIIAKLEANALVRGAVSDALTAAARDLAAGQPIATVGARFLAAARQADTGAGGEGIQRSAGDGGADHARSGEGKGPEDEGPEPPVEGQEGFFQRKVPLPPASGPDLFAPPRQEAEAPPRAGAPEPGQGLMPGMDPSAVQAQASRDQTGRGALTTNTPQLPADVGLFAPKSNQQDLFAPKPAAPETSAAPAKPGPNPQSSIEDPWDAPHNEDHLIPANYPPQQAHQIAADLVFTAGRRDGFEHIAAVDQSSGQILHMRTDGRAGSVGLDLGRVMEFPTDSIVVHHNHPSSTALSEPDLLMLRFPAFSHIVAVGHNGNVSIARLGEAFRGDRGEAGKANLSDADVQAVAPLQSAIARLWGRSVSVMNAVLRKAMLDYGDAHAAVAPYTNDVVLRLLHAAGVIEYTSSHQLPAGAMRALREHLQQAGHDADTIDRSTRSVQSHQGIAGLSQGLQSAPRPQEPNVQPANQPGAGARVPERPQGPPPAWGRQGRLLEALAEREEEAPRVPLYSAVDRAVGALRQTKGTGEQMLAQITKAAGVKPEEIKYLGLGDWLAGQKSVTKQQIQDYVRANALDVREVPRGKMGAEAADQRFQSYTLPGGEDYSELLLTLPDKRAALEQKWLQLTQEARDTHRARLESEVEHGINDPRTQALARRYEELAAKRAAADKERLTAENFHAGHWPEPNILAHARTTERMSPDGKRVLMVEEVQSDWHQAGRKKGYYDPNGTEQVPYGAVPDAPFKTTWPALVMKRMLKYATDNGFDRIAWSPGHVHADRYGLAQSVGRLRYVDTHGAEPFAAGALTAYGHDGDIVASHDVHSRPDLEGLVGQDVTQRLLDAEPKLTQRVGAPTSRTRVLTGEGLQMGGHGMSGFYDKILPAEVNKLIKPFGGRVGRSEVHTERSIDQASGRPPGAQTDTVHSIEITPAMRKAIGEEGLPLFSRRKKGKGEPAAQQPLTHQATAHGDRISGATPPPETPKPAPAVTPEAQRARDTLNAASRGVMRWLGLPETVGLNFVDHLLSGGADGSYQHNLITYALDTASADAPIKFWHEAVHALRDKGLGLLTDTQNKALDVAAHKWLNDRNEGQQRQFEMRSQGITDPIEMREEAIAQMAEAALRAGEKGRTLMGAVAHLWRNFGRGIGQMLRGQGYHTADDVFAALMRGERATPTAAGDLVSAALRGAGHTPGGGQAQPGAAAVAGESVSSPGTARNAKPTDYIVNGTKVTLPDTYFSRRTPQWLQNRTQTSAVARAAVAIDDARERISDSVMHAISPMTQGSKRAMDYAFRFANAQRAIQQEYGRIDRNITTNFDPAARARMGTAMDNESVFEQQLAQALHPPAPPAQGVLGQPPPPPPPPPPTPAMVAQMRAAFDAGGTGIAGLAPAERAVVQQLAQLAAGTWQRMQSRGMVAPGAEGLPFYFARQIILRGPGDEISSAGSQGGGRDINEIGKNLTTQGAMKRKHLTPQETEQAAKAALGQNAELLTDVRSLIQRLASQERGVAGTDLINAIERVGQLTGVNTVVRGTIPGALNPADYFTLNHPSFRQWAGGGWQDIRVAREFEGPLKGVLSTKTGDAYNALMKVKGFSMHAIMYSPLMHLSVEFGRAFPLMPLKMLALLPFTRGHRLMQDEAYMRNAVQHGLAPIGQGWSLDPVRIAEEARTGQGFLAQLQQNPLGRAAATAWDWWSRRVLWDNVFRLQVGIYDEMLSRFQRKGFAPDVAATMAGHIANRYAGALPPENLSKLTNQIANLTLFSRSFTLGNLGVIKDMMNGAPQHIRATIEQMASPQVADQAQAALKRKAQSAFIMDVGIMLAANSGAQLLAQTLIRGWSMGLPQAAQDVYDEWVTETKQSFSKVGQNPLNAFGFLPQYHNEPGKQQRVHVGNDSEGRGVYFRLAAGKIGEEFLGWFTHPGDMVLNKLSPQLRPFLELAIGEDTLHRPILKPDPKTIGDYLSNAGRTVTHLFQAQLPIGAIGGLHDVVTGAKGGDPFIAAAKVAVPFTGLGQLSSGYPGGPEAGKIAGYKRSKQFDIKQAYPAATRAAQSGAPDAIATAARILRDAGEEDLKQAFRTAKFLANPSVAVARSRGRYLRTHPGAREAMEE